MIFHKRIPEVRRRGMPLGRHILHDERSRNHPAAEAEQIVDVMYGSMGLPLNQGMVGKCTAESLCGCLNTDPNNEGSDPSTGQIRLLTDVDSDALYRKETAEEGYPWPQFDPGGTGLAVCKAAKELGWISGYTHSFSPQAALKALSLRPGMMGSNWYDSMDVPNDKGIVTVSPNASIRGGHEYFAYQILVEDKLIGFWNSWGPAWGIGGRFFMEWGTVERLLGEQGDVTFPIK